MQLAKIQAAVKSAPNYRAMVGGLEVIGSPGKFRWSFEYVVRVARTDGKSRTAYGKRNAEEYVATLADDTPINTDIKTFGKEFSNIEPQFVGYDDEGLAVYEIPFKL
jgi:hypothetical protein